MESSAVDAIREDYDLGVIPAVMLDPGVLVTETTKLCQDLEGSTAHGRRGYATGVGPPGMARNSSPGVGSIVWWRPSLSPEGVSRM